MALFDIIPDEYQVNTRAVVKLKTSVAKPGRKHPDVTGFICVSQEWLDRVSKSLLDAQARGEHITFLSIALWDSVGEYNLSGSVDVKLDKGRYDVPAPLKDNPQQQSDWY